MRIENINDSDYEMRKECGYSLAVVGKEEDLDIFLEMTSHGVDFPEEEKDGLISYTVFDEKRYETKKEFRKAVVKELREARKKARKKS